jgi:hypothetical protein
LELISNSVSFITTSGRQMYPSGGYFKGAIHHIPRMPGSEFHLKTMSTYHNMIQQPGVEIIASAIYLETT